MVDKVHISWVDFHQHAKLLAEKIKKTGSYNKIIAVSRGGLIPACIIAYELDIRNTQAINISNYDHQDRRDSPEINIKCDAFQADEQTLIIDDLSDTGQTFRLLRTMFPRATLASVYAKAKGSKDVDLYAVDIPDRWLVFPWDI